MNKKGADRETMAIIWMIAILGITALIVAWGMSIFYGTPYDIRELEARLLMNDVADCVSYAGTINNKIIDKGIVDKGYTTFLDSCSLNFNSPEWELEQYYVELKVYKSSDLNNEVFFSTKGNKELALDCTIQEVAVAEVSSKCLERTFKTFDDKNQEYTVKLLTAVRKSEKNVKQ